MKSYREFINEEKETLKTGSESIVDSGIDKEEKKDIESNNQEHKKNLEDNKKLKEEQDEE